MFCSTNRTKIISAFTREAGRIAGLIIQDSSQTLQQTCDSDKPQAGACDMETSDTHQEGGTDTCWAESGGAAVLQ